jgi:drug/metabolite transporter (DMT)-like permease
MTAPTIQNPGLISWALLVLLSIIWGASFISVSFALESFSPLMLAAMRILIAAICLTSLAFIIGDKLPTLSTKEGQKIWLHCLGMGLFSNVIPFSLLSWGQQYVSSGFAGICMAIVPLIVLPLSIIFVTEEYFSFKKLIGCSIGFLGVILLIGPNSILNQSENIISSARLACVGAAACYSIGSIFTRRCPKVSLISFSAAALILASIIIVPTALITEGLPQNLSIKSFIAISYLGFIPTAVATIILVRIIQTAGPAFMSQVNYQVPIWSIIFGTLFLNEILPAQFFFAFLLIVTGLLITQAKIWRLRP